MVKLSAMTTDEAEVYQIGGEPVDEAEANESQLLDKMIAACLDGKPEAGHEVCGIPCRPIKILLAKSLVAEMDDDRYADGANIDAWLDLRDDSVFCWEESWDDPYYLEAEEFKSLEDSKEPEEVAIEKSPMTVTWEPTGWEAEALGFIKQARDRVATMEARYLDAKERAKDAKSDWEAAVNHLTATIDSAIKPLPLFDRPAVKQETTADPTDEAWRETPISEIFKGVKGLGAKKREAIQEVIPTLGAFEDLRKKASLEGNPLQGYMPKGVGQEACDQLEEASLNAISRIMTLGDEDEEDVE